MRRPAIVTVLASLAGILAFFAPTAHAASWSSSSYASRLLSLVNQARAGQGLAPLDLATGTTSVAASWTSHLASAQALSHNPSLEHQLETHGSSNWTVYGENVGQGMADNPDQLFEAYMHSPEHRANIMTAEYRYVGVAVVFTGARSWNTFDFVDAYGRTAAPAPVQHTVHHTAPAVHHASPSPRPARPAVHHTARPAVHHTARPAVHHTKARHHAKAHQAVQVRAVQLRSPEPQSVPASSADMVTTALTTPLAPGTNDGSRNRAVAIAFALIALTAGARAFVRRTSTSH